MTGRVFLVVMDSVGIGGAPDADQFFNGDIPDTGANTVAHILTACRDRQAEEGRSGPLQIPTLAALGLGEALALADGVTDHGLPPATGAFGLAIGSWRVSPCRGIGTPFPRLTPPFPTI